MESKPYIESIIEETESALIVERTFRADLNWEELKWHWDEEDRTIKLLEKTDWEFQFDNELPVSFDKEIFIPKGVMHRIIKGNGDLRIQIIKHK